MANETTQDIMNLIDSKQIHELETLDYMSGKESVLIDDGTVTYRISVDALLGYFVNRFVGNTDEEIDVTALNAGGEVVGSMTKVYSPAVVNAPDTSGFNPDTTFYVTYDDNEKEHSTTPISKGVPQYWYEYGESKWANIVTRNNGLETYYTWIPRYEFTLDQTNERSTVKFITGTSTQTDSG